MSGVLLLEPLEGLFGSVELLLSFLCFFLLVLVSVELFWSVPEVPLAVEEPDWLFISELEEPLELGLLVELLGVWELLGELLDCGSVLDEGDVACAAAMPIEKIAAVAIARSFLDIFIHLLRRSGV